MPFPNFNMSSLTLAAAWSAAASHQGVTELASGSTSYASGPLQSHDSLSFRFHPLNPAEDNDNDSLRYPN